MSFVLYAVHMCYIAPFIELSLASCIRSACAGFYRSINWLVSTLRGRNNFIPVWFSSKHAIVYIVFTYFQLTKLCYIKILGAGLRLEFLQNFASISLQSRTV